MLTKFNLLIEKHMSKSGKIDKTPMFEIRGLIVCGVDGSQIRNLISAEYMGGGHAFVYNYVPKREIWLEKKVMQENPSETVFILFHELNERTLMDKQNLEYDQAHDFSNLVEEELRKHYTKIKGKYKVEPDCKTVTGIKEVLADLSDVKLPEDVALQFNGWHEMDIKEYLLGLAKSAKGLEKKD